MAVEKGVRINRTNSTDGDLKLQVYETIPVANLHLKLDLKKLQQCLTRVMMRCLLWTTLSSGLRYVWRAFFDPHTYMHLMCVCVCVRVRFLFCVVYVCLLLHTSSTTMRMCEVRSKGSGIASRRRNLSRTLTAQRKKELGRRHIWL